MRAAASRAAEAVVQRVGVRRAVDVAGERAEAERVGHGLEVHRHREVGAAVVRVLEHRDAGAAGVLAGDLDAVLDGLGAGVDQHGLLGEVAGGVLGEQLGDAHVLLVGRDGEQRVHDVGELRLRGRHDGVVGVADRGHADARAEVDELVAVDVDQDRAVGARDVHREGAGDAVRDHARGDVPAGRGMSGRAPR